MKVLHNVFIKAAAPQMRCAILDAVLAIFKKDPANYYISRPKMSLTVFLKTEGSTEQYEKVYRILEYVMCTLHFVPFEELQVLAEALDSAPQDFTELGFSMVIKAVTFNTKYADVFREAGLLDVMIAKLVRYGSALKERMPLFGTGPGAAAPAPAAPPPDPTAENQFAPARKLSTTDFYYGDAPAPVVSSTQQPQSHRQASDAGQYFMLMMEALVLVLGENVVNCDAFRRLGGSRALFAMVSMSETRLHALRVIQRLVLDDSIMAQDDLSTLLELMQTSPADHVDIKVDVLLACLRLFSLEPRIKAMFREVQGFVYIISCLVTLAGPADTSAPGGISIERKMELVRRIFETLTAALVEAPGNKETMSKSIRYDILADSLKLSGLLGAEQTAAEIFVYLLTMACEGFGKQIVLDPPAATATLPEHCPPIPTVYNAEAVRLTVALLKLTPAPLWTTVLARILHLTGREANAQVMAVGGVTAAVLTLIKDPSANRASLVLQTPAVRELGYKLVSRLCGHALNSMELKLFLRMKAGDHPGELVALETVERLVSMERSAAKHRGAPFIEFSMAEKGFSALFYSQVSGRGTPKPGISARPLSCRPGCARRAELLRLSNLCCRRLLGSARVLRAGGPNHSRPLAGQEPTGFGPFQAASLHPYGSGSLSTRRKTSRTRSYMTNRLN